MSHATPHPGASDRPSRAPRPPRRPAFTLIEASMSTAIIAIMIGAGLSAVSQASKTRLAAAQRAQARTFATLLLREAAAKPYVDPQSGSGPIGPEAGENQGNRSSLDDCDDYHGLSISPIVSESGDALSSAQWSASMNVMWIDLTDAPDGRWSDAGLKRIDVTIRLRGVVMFQASYAKSRSWEGMQ